MKEIKAKSLRVLFAENGRWTRNANARRRRGDGDECDATDPKAVCWCLRGGCIKVYGRNTSAFHRAWMLITDAVHRLTNNSLIDPATFNDTQRNVVAIRKVVKLAKV